MEVVKMRVFLRNSILRTYRRQKNRPVRAPIQIYKANPAIRDAELLFDVINAEKKNCSIHCICVVRCHDSFYTDKEEEIDNYWSEKGILASDMETAALFVIGGCRGIKTASIFNVVA